MSSTLRIGLIAEGVTDYEVLKAAIEAMLDGQSFDIKLLQPDSSVAFTGAGNAGPLGGGWRGVYKWCLLAAQRGNGRWQDDPVFGFYDLYVLHLDADVAGEDPANDPVNPIPQLAGTLPCEQSCPPPNATTDRLRQLMLLWIGEAEVPPRTVLCTPSKCVEAWVIATFFPHDGQMIKRGWECQPDPASRLGQQPKANRFAKRQADYRARSTGIRDGCQRIANRLTEAKRFQDEFTTVLKASGSAGSE
jgi:hypothetical protein